MCNLQADKLPLPLCSLLGSGIIKDSVLNEIKGADFHANNICITCAIRILPLARHFYCLLLAESKAGREKPAVKSVHKVDERSGRDQSG